MQDRAKVLEMPTLTPELPDTQGLMPMRTITRAPRNWSLLPNTFGEAMEIAKLIAESEFAPKDYRGKPANVVIAIQMGADVGLSPMQALQNIAVINGRPAIWGDAALALVQGGGVLERCHEFFEGQPNTDAYTAVCIVKRKGFPDEIRRTFSIADAKVARLWGKTGRDGQPTPWITYPSRMLQMRARGFALRDAAADRLLGLILAEEAMDLDTSVSVSVGSPPSSSAFEALPEAVRDQIEKAFATLNLAPGLRIAKLHEYLGGDGVDPAAGAAQLLDWCRDEFAKRKTGMPRAKAKPTNDKAKGTLGPATAPPTPVAESTPVPVISPEPPTPSPPVPPPPAVPAPAPAPTVPPAATVPDSGDLF
jgi:hypothetical protein